MWLRAVSLHKKEGDKMNQKVGIGYILEEKGFRSWPAKIQQPYYESILRLTEGKTKRANSVYTVGSMPSNSEWLSTIEDYYISRNIDPCFYISDYSPKELDTILEKKWSQSHFSSSFAGKSRGN